MKLTCAELEARLEALAAGTLSESRAAACEEHLLTCQACARLLELATVPVPTGVDGETDLAAAVLARTSGPACAQAEALLSSPGEERLAAGERALLALHLRHCRSCHALAAALGALDRDLPLLAELAPGRGFVERVMAASLPLPVRLRRWRRHTWPAWVRRPRFALELAYALTALFVVTLNIAGTPLAAMPRQAAELARAAPLEAIEEPVLEGLTAWGASARQRLGGGWDATEAKIRTFRDDLASWWENATEDRSSRQAESTEETS